MQKQWTHATALVFKAHQRVPKAKSARIIKNSKITKVLMQSCTHAVEPAYTKVSNRYTHTTFPLLNDNDQNPPLHKLDRLVYLMDQEVQGYRFTCTCQGCYSSESCLEGCAPVKGRLRTLPKPEFVEAFIENEFVSRCLLKGRLDDGDCSAIEHEVKNVLHRRPWTEKSHKGKLNYTAKKYFQDAYKIWCNK